MIKKLLIFVIFWNISYNAHDINPIINPNANHINFIQQLSEKEKYSLLKYAITLDLKTVITGVAVYNTHKNNNDLLSTSIVGVGTYGGLTLLEKTFGVGDEYKNAKNRYLQNIPENEKIRAIIFFEKTERGAFGAYNLCKLARWLINRF